jgi:hypothetical protein
VFPLAPNSKVPPKGFHFTEEASSDPETIGRWFTDGSDWNIGVLTDDMIVVDVDNKKGKRGTQSFLDQGYPLDTFVVRTPTAGLHVYYTGPNKALSAGKLGEGLDIRSYHGYVVGPGSVIDGVPYTVDCDGPILAAPPELIARLDEPRERQAQVPAVVLDQEDAVRRAEAFLLVDAPVAVEGAGGDHATFKVACAVKDLGVSEAMAVDLMAEHWNPRCCPPWAPDELAVKVANAYAYGQNAPGAHSPRAEFAGVDVPEAPAPVHNAEPGLWFQHGDAWSGRVDWLFYGLLEKGGVGLLVGPAQAGKTFVALELARCLATGKPFFGVEPDDRGGTAFLFAGTEGSGFAARLAALGEEGRLPIAGRPVAPLSQAGALVALEVDLAALDGRMRETHGVPLRLVVLETLSACGLLPDENDNAAAAAAFTALAALARRLNVLLVVTHHPPKTGQGERGAGAIRGSADFALEIERPGKSKVRTLELTKARNAEQKVLGGFTLVPVVLAVDERGREVVSMSVSQAGAEPAAVKDAAHAQLFMDCLDWALTDDGAVIEGRACAEVEAVRAVFYERKPGSRDRSNLAKAFKAAMAWAEDGGLIDVIPQGARKYLAPLQLV